jgi:SAM-dependent methyltransferase
MFSRTDKSMNLLQSIHRIRPWLGRMALTRKVPGVGSDDKGLIDFREIVARHSFSEHAARADKYFASIGVDSPDARKPFAAPAEAAELCAGLAALLPNLMLFPGARVLDFGAGTCWMARLLALLGCEVTAVDVSRNALEVGEKLIRSDAFGDRLNVKFVPLDGPALPFADGTFDRVICFDALHHVPDQQAAIREFARVLKDGGIAALHEPGPAHSRSSQSQYEMRMFDVIEADVHVEKLIEAGYAAGFTGAQLAVYAGPLQTDLDGFNDFLANPKDSLVGRRFVAHTATGLENRRTFFLTKGDAQANMDSRSPFGLLASIDVSVSSSESHTKVQGSITNIGSNTWLPSFTGIGAVNLGVHLHAAGGQLINGDYARFALSSDKVLPGQSRAVEMSIPNPPGLDAFELVIDLVAEGVAWFEIVGGTPARFRIRSSPPVAERM